MKRFKNILVVYRGAVGDDDALTQATALASRNGAQLTLIEVFDEEKVSAFRRAESQKHLDRLAVSIACEGIPVNAVVRFGTPFMRIIQEVLVQNHDLVITSAERHVGFKDLFFGSTSMHLMRTCPCPGSLGRPGIAGMLIGKTADLVLRQVQCAVLTVKPEDFSTPVTQQKFFVAAGPVRRDEVRQAQR